MGRKYFPFHTRKKPSVLERSADACLLQVTTTFKVMVVELLFTVRCDTQAPPYQTPLVPALFLRF
jgi:hypothetical protein